MPQDAYRSVIFLTNGLLYAAKNCHGKREAALEEDPNPSPAHAARLQAELDKHGKTYELRMYRHAGHAFFADYRPSYRAAAAQDM